MASRRRSSGRHRRQQQLLNVAQARGNQLGALGTILGVLLWRFCRPLRFRFSPRSRPARPIQTKRQGKLVVSSWFMDEMKKLRAEEREAGEEPSPISVMAIIAWKPRKSWSATAVTQGRHRKTAPRHGRRCGRE